MKDLDYYLIKCSDIIKSCGIPLGNVSSISINTRAKKRWGLCTKVNKSFKIQISDRLLSDDVLDKYLEDTLIHELLHTCPGCYNHGPKWKLYANQVNSKYGYNIKRCTSSEEKGLKHLENHVRIGGESIYQVRCTGCGYIYRRLKFTKLVKHPEYYLCGKCSGKLERIADFS